MIFKASPDPKALTKTLPFGRGDHSLREVPVIGTRGGLTQIAFTLPVLQNRLGIYSSFGVDDPNDKDLVSASHRDWRKRNLAFASDVTFKFTSQFSVGAEVRRFQTNYFYSSRQNANHVNLGTSYTF